MTNMVFEFTDTRGVMGMHYARHDGEAEDVAVALNEQYQPRFAGDDLPSNPVACALAIADKMDTGGYLRYRSASERRQRPVCAASCRAWRAANYR